MSQVAPLSGVKPNVVNGAQSLASSATTAKSDGEEDVETEADDPARERCRRSGVWQVSMAGMSRLTCPFMRR